MFSYEPGEIFSDSDEIVGLDVNGIPSLPGWLNISTSPLTFSGKPTTTEHIGLSTITVTAQDSFGENTSTAFTINVSSRPLTLTTATINHEISGGQPFAYDIAFNNLNNSTLEYTVTVTDSASGWLTVSTAATTVSFSGMPINITHLGLSTITVTARDSFGESTSTAFTINVSSQPLTLSTATINHGISGGQPFSYEIAFSNLNNSILEYTVTVTNSASGWLRVSTNNTTVSFNGTPTTAEHLGLSTITVTAQDSFGESTSTAFTINVSSQPLTLSTATVNHEISGGQPFSYEIAFNNPNNSILGYMITVTGPASSSSGWLRVSTNNTTVLFNGTPVATAHLGLSTITVTAQDAFDETIASTFTIKRIQPTADTDHRNDKPRNFY